MNLRAKMAADHKCSDPVAAAAVLLLAYECGDDGFDTTDPAACGRIRALALMTDEEFDEEHRRVVDAKRRGESWKAN